MTQILVGYEVNTEDPRRAGRDVTVPLKHTAVLGQTQESGKTTTQEAMITRSGLRAVAFLTKRGEQSFRLSRPIQPFFREAKGDEFYRYVVAAIEGMLEVKLSFDAQSLVLKLCREYGKVRGSGKKATTVYGWKAARTLEAVMQNLRTAMPHLRGREEATAMQIEEHLKRILPEIAAAGFADSLKIRDGINVMDLTSLSPGLQALVIASVIDWVHQRERRTIVIIPEAWKFIPEGRSSAVKRAAERLIREGAAISNFVWIDSQDLRGVDKMILRSVSVWLFGVQRERNEVSNTLDSMPAVPKPTATDITRLSKGQFYVAYGDTLVKTYVRPAGMEAEQARAIARGEESADSWKQIVRTLDEKNDDEQGGGSDRADATEEEAAAVAVGDLECGDHSIVEESGGGLVDDPENESECARSAPDSLGSDGDEGEGADEMWKEKYDQLKIEFEQLRDAHDKIAKRLEELLAKDVPDFTPARPVPGQEPNGGNGAGTSTPAPAAAIPSRSSGGLQVKPAPAGATDFPNGGVPSYNDIYHYVTTRAAQEKPAILKLIVDRPELQVEITRRTISIADTSTQGRLGLLIHEKFFDAPRDAGDITREFKRRGWFEPKASNAALIKPLGQIAEWGFLTRESDGFQAVPSMKVNVVKA